MDKIDAWTDDSGIYTETSVDPTTGRFVVQKKQDIAPNLEYATALRNADQYSSDGIKKGWFHVAHIPNVVVAELLQHGVNVYRDDAKAIVAGLKKIGKDGLLTTRKRV